MSTAKYPDKIFVWITISSKGVSKPFYREAGNAINQYVHLEHCIQKRLEPFFEEHHLDDDFVFWPDLASAYYAKIVLDYLKDKKSLKPSQEKTILQICQNAGQLRNFGQY